MKSKSFSHLKRMPTIAGGDHIKGERHHVEAESGDRRPVADGGLCGDPGRAKAQAAPPRSIHDGATLFTIRSLKVVEAECQAILSRPSRSATYP
jgi:hypothetical protein